MAEDSSRYWSPSRTYEFELKIGKIDLTPDLISVKIFTTLDNPYQTITLDLFLDSADIILEEIYGQKPLKLKIKLFGTSDYLPQEQIDMELMYLSSKMPVETSTPVQSNETSKNRDPISIVCVARNAYTTMNTVVNSVYQAKSMASIIGDIVSGQVEAELKIDSQGINKSDIDQVVIPASTLYQNLLYLNRTFGIYSGMVGIYCDYNNVVHIKNLTDRMKKNEKFIVYQLPLGQDNSKVIDECTDGKRFYTTKNLNTTYKGNSAFAFMAPTLKHVVKPKDRLYHTITTDLEEFSKEYGLISKGNKMFFDSEAIPKTKRVSIHKDHTGYELDETFIQAKYSRRVSSITEMSVQLERSIRITNLMEVGETIKLDTRIDVSRDFTGTYILKSSMLNFLRGKDWEATGMLNLMRTNRTTT